MALRSTPFLIVTGTLMTILFFVSFFSPRSDTLARSWQSTTHNRPPPGSVKIDVLSELGRASNSTLGFEKILVVGLKERTDKRDVLTLQSSLTGLDIEWEDGVKGDEVSEKALPPGTVLTGAGLGSYRGHLNAVRRIVSNKLTSALIMEDDMDWDLRVRSQTLNVARGVRHLSAISRTARQHSPYGDDWDVIWLGHCGERELPEDPSLQYIISNDPTVILHGKDTELRGNLDKFPERTRMVYKAGMPICTFAYAVSYRGAQKILYALGTHAQTEAYDNALAYFCRDGSLNMKCYSVQPMLFFHHRPAGPMDKDSDINNGDHTAVREKAFTEHILWSARLNLEQLLTGSENYTTQWVD